MKIDLLNCALGLAAAALVVPRPADAAMSCWSRDEAAAAKTRDLQSHLMVAAMRCRALGIDVLASYNEFVRANRSTLQAANGVLRAQFERGYGAEGEVFYDRFTTALANDYGDDPTDPAICDGAEATSLEAAGAGGEIAALLTLADRLGVAPALPGGECPISFTALE